MIARIFRVGKTQHFVQERIYTVLKLCWFSGKDLWEVIVTSLMIIYKSWVYIKSSVPIFLLVESSATASVK